MEIFVHKNIVHINLKWFSVFSYWPYQLFSIFLCKFSLIVYQVHQHFSILLFSFLFLFLCLQMADTHRKLLMDWRERARTSQIEARRVIAEMLIPSGINLKFFKMSGNYVFILGFFLLVLMVCSWQKKLSCYVNF